MAWMRRLLMAAAGVVLMACPFGLYLLTPAGRRELGEALMLLGFVLALLTSLITGIVLLVRAITD